MPVALGLRELQFVYAEGLAMGEKSRQVALDSANQTINRLAA